MKKFFAFVLSLINGDWLRSAVDEGLIDHSGQGRDKYGR